MEWLDGRENNGSDIPDHLASSLIRGSKNNLIHFIRPTIPSGNRNILGCISICVQKKHIFSCMHSNLNPKPDFRALKVVKYGWWREGITRRKDKQSWEHTKFPKFLMASEIEIDKLVDLIVEGNPGSIPPEPLYISHFLSLHQSFCAKAFVKSTGQVIQEEEIEGCKNEYELVNLLHSNFQWSPVPEVSVDRGRKSSLLSSKFRERGNSEYKSGSLSLALHAYNLALTFALRESELSLAYANRSALSLRMGYFREALEDLERALNLLDDEEDEKLRNVLLQRREKCIKGMKIKKQSDDLEDEKAYFHSTYFRLKNPNFKRIPKAEEWVEIDYREDRGRRLVTNKDVPAGTLILIDNPYVSVINNLLLWEFHHCHNCSKIIEDGSGIPCAQCTFTIYCNEDCLKESSSLGGNHGYEHSYLSYLQSLSLASTQDPSFPTSIIHRELLSLRILGLVGAKRIYELFKEFKKCGKIFSEGYLDPETGLYDIASYRANYHLVSHGVDAFNAKEKVQDVFEALFLAHLVKESSEYFKDEKENYSNDILLFTASLILHHFWNVKYNCISVSKLGMGSTSSSSFATAVYSLVSLCNHSCDPNAAPVKKFERLETSLITLKDLKAGDEIFISYKPLFPVMKVGDRIEVLKRNYNFICDCEPCRKGWGPKSVRMEGLEEELVQRIKRNCETCKNSPEICQSCGILVLQKMSETERYERKFENAKSLVQEGKRYIEALETLKECLSFFCNNFSPCASHNQVTLHLFKQILVLLAYRVQNYKS